MAYLTTSLCAHCSNIIILDEKQNFMVSWLNCTIMQKTLIYHKILKSLSMHLVGFLTAQNHSTPHSHENELKHLYVYLKCLGNKCIHISSNFVKSGKILGGLGNL